jgi:hypothetical protein
MAGSVENSDECGVPQVAHIRKMQREHQRSMRPT